ncbi:MAG: carbohydrate ABC transporter permease [Firmicutes bacterium]|nr:carbohydrate ABC transporter permease [Bacillota bacterium]
MTDAGIINRKKTRAYRIKRLKTAAYYICLCVFALFFLLPVFVMASKSLFTFTQINERPGSILPMPPVLYNFSLALNRDMLVQFKNTLIIVSVNVIFVPFTAALCAYGFSKLEFWGREVFFAVVLSTIMLPGIVTMIPLYVTYVNIGWFDTLLPFTVPALFGGGAINIFLFRQFMRGISSELHNAAKIDGASSFTIFLRIILPICIPIFVYIMINTFFGVWNDFTGPLIYLRSAEKYTLAVGVYNRFLGSMTQPLNQNVQMAAAVLIMLPCALLFLVFQRTLIEGIMLGGVKG